MILNNFKKNANGVCEVANDNADGQIIISGDKESIDLFSDIIER